MRGEEAKEDVGVEEKVREAALAEGREVVRGPRARAWNCERS